MSVGNIDTSSIGQTTQASLRPTLTQPKPQPTTAVSGATGAADAAAKKTARPSDTADTADTALTSLDTRSAADSLQDQIRAAREQLNDWVTCVSSTTPQGQAEIRSLSTQISAAQEQIDHLPQAAAATSAAGSVDLWA